MKNSFRLICLALIVLGFSGVADAQVAAWSEGGPKIVITSLTEPSGAKQKVVGSIQTTDAKNLFSRVYVDSERGIYFGYDLTVEPTAEAKRYKLTFKPLSISPDSLFFGGSLHYPTAVAGDNQVSSPNSRRNAKLTALTLPKYPEPQIVGEGETLAFDVLFNMQAGIKIIDLIKVLAATAPLPQTLSSTAAVADGSPDLFDGYNRRSSPGKDFRIDAVELKISSSKLLVNGRTLNAKADKSRLGLTGALVWFYLPLRGRFVVSLTARGGFDFQKIGTVERNNIKFSIGGNTYEWISDSPVVTSGNDVWNLWVLHDKNYKPESEPTSEHPYVMGAADNTDFLVKKK